MALEEELVALETEVATLPDVAGSVDRVIDDLLARIEAAGTDPARIAAVVAGIRSHKEAIIASVLKGTPVDPEPEPTPE